MKFILPVVLSLPLFFSAQHVQAQESRFTFGLRAGLNLSDAAEEAGYIIGEKKSKFGFQAGFVANYHFFRSLYLQSGLSLTTKGTVHERAEMWIGGENAPVTYSKTTTRQTYLQVPLKLGYQLHLNGSSALFVHAGPYVAYGIGGKETTKNRTVSSSGDIPDEKTTAPSFGERTTLTNGFLKEDYGLIFGVGTSYRKLSLMVECDLGLVDIDSKSPDGERTYRNRNLSLTFGYNF